MGVHILHDFYDVAHALSFEEAVKDIALCGRNRTPDRKGQHGTAPKN